MSKLCMSLPFAISLALTLSACSSSGSDAPSGEPGEITGEVPLLAEDGTLAAHGWARGPLMQYDRALVQEARTDQLVGLIDGARQVLFLARARKD